MRVVGGSWEQWEDDLTMDRLNAIMDSAKEHPPTHLTLAAIARGLGAISESEGGTKPKTAKQNAAGPETFMAMFGSSGNLSSGGQVH